MYEGSLSKGLVTARTPNNLGEGELAVATGIWYPPGDVFTASKINGRVRLVPNFSFRVDGLALCIFDNVVNTRLIALVNGELQQIAVEVDDAVSLLSSGHGSKLDSAHFNDSWVLVSGAKNIVLHPDLTMSPLGLLPPTGNIATSFSSDINFTFADSHLETGPAPWVDPAFAYNQDINLYAHPVYLTTPGSNSIIFSWTISKALIDPLSIFFAYSIYSVPGSFKVKFEYNIDLAGWVEFTETEHIGQNWEDVLLEMTIPAGLVTDADQVQVRVTPTRVSGFILDDWFRLRSFYIIDSSVGGATPEDIEFGLIYLVTAWDSVRQIESLPHPLNNGLFFKQDNVVTVTLDLSSIVVTPETTHLKIYRTSDGGNLLDAGYTGSMVPVGTDSWTDTNIGTAQPTGGKDSPGGSVVPQVSVSSLQDQAPLAVYRDEVPPPFERITYYRGYMVGIPGAGQTGGVGRRTLRYNVPGFLHSWPSLSVINSFPLRENDLLVDVVEAGQSLIIAAQGGMIRLDELPRTVLGTYITGESKQIQGAPGVVSEYCLAGCSVGNEPRAAWVSPYGIYHTNGYQFQRISDDIDWRLIRSDDMVNWSLHWDKERLCLVFAQDALGFYYLIHLDPMHAKGNGQPKWTGPHFGSITSMHSGEVGGQHVLYSGNPSGGVFIEDDPSSGMDDSNAFDQTGTVPLIATGPITYQDWQDWVATSGRILHRGFTDSAAVQFKYTTTRDSSGKSRTKIISLKLGKDGWTQFEVGRSGSSHQWSLEHFGVDRGKFDDIKIDADILGRSGMV